MMVGSKKFLNKNFSIFRKIITFLVEILGSLVSLQLKKKLEYLGCRNLKVWKALVTFAEGFEWRKGLLSCFECPGTGTCMFDRLGV